MDLENIEVNGISSALKAEISAMDSKDSKHKVLHLLKAVKEYKKLTYRQYERMEVAKYCFALVVPMSIGLGIDIAFMVYSIIKGCSLIPLIVTGIIFLICILVSSIGMKAVFISYKNDYGIYGKEVFNDDNIKIILEKIINGRDNNEV